MAKGLYDLENRIKELIAEDIDNPDIFYAIKDLALAYLKRYKKMSWGDEAEEVSLLIAEDLYLKVYQGKPINMWIAYISRSCMGYIREYRRMTGTEFIDTTGDPILEDALVTMNIGGSYDSASGRVYRELENIESLGILANVIVGVMDRSRYRRYTAEYYNSHISILASILLGRRTEFQLDQVQSMYLGILLAATTDAVRETLIYLNQEDPLFGGGSLMAMFSLSQLDVTTDE